MEPIPSGGGNTKAELSDLPALASPLQFGDWIHLCGAVMRDLSPVASRWWDLTTRPAGVHLSGVAGSNTPLGLSHVEEQAWQTNSHQRTSMAGQTDLF